MHMRHTTPIQSNVQPKWSSLNCETEFQKKKHFNILQYYCYSNQIYVVYTSVEAICGPVCSYSNKIGIQNTVAYHSKEGI